MPADARPRISTAHRKLAAKRFNERLKLLVSTTNTIGLGILAAATIVPNFGQPVPGSVAGRPWWAGPLAFVALFCIALATLRLLRSEDLP